jgi:hypothetical protein
MSACDPFQPVTSSPIIRSFIGIVLTKTLLTTSLFLLLTAFSVAKADPSGECEGTPEDAVMILPAAMDEWAQIICTPFGHIIAAEEGWIWSYPGGFNPVMVPSQMVRSNPEEVGNASYFRKIEFVPAESDNVEKIRAALNEGFDVKDNPGSVYRLSVENQDGKPLRLYFDVTDDGKNTWGIWCADECDTDLRFMVLDMRE